MIHFPIDQNIEQLIAAKRDALGAKAEILKALAKRESPFFYEALKNLNHGIEVINKQLEAHVNHVIRYGTWDQQVTCEN